MWTIESDERILILWKLESSPSNSFADLIGPPCRSRLGLVTWDPYQSFQVTPPMSYLLEINQLILLSLHSSFSQQGTLCSPSVQRTNSMNQQWNYIVLAVSQHPVYQSSSNIHISNLQLVKFGSWTSAPQIPRGFCFCQSCLWHKSDNPSYNQSDSRRKPRWNKLWTSSGVFSPKVVEFLMFKVFHDEDIEISGKGNVKIEFCVDGLVISDVLIIDGCLHGRLRGHSTLAMLDMKKRWDDTSRLAPTSAVDAVSGMITWESRNSWKIWHTIDAAKSTRVTRFPVVGVIYPREMCVWQECVPRKHFNASWSLMGFRN